MTVQRYDTVILGGGMTGLAASIASGHPVFEACEVPGGICASYYMRPGETTRLSESPSNDAYRFEYGGGHWIFGGDPAVLKFINTLVPIKAYQRHSAVYFPHRELYVPYPLQNHLSYLGKEIASTVLTEIVAAPRTIPKTIAQWLEQNFGATLTKMFFAPFHELYTAGLWTRIAPQDDYKSPTNLCSVIEGVFGMTSPVGYNATFVYPSEGLSTLASRMASYCQVHFGKQAVRIDPQQKVIEFTDGTAVHYERLLSTLPLNYMCEIASLSVDAEPDPHTSVLVINLGGTRGPRCPDYHWIYTPTSQIGFHRVGFYSNVDQSFLPHGAQNMSGHVSIYVEKAYLGGCIPSEDAIAAVCQGVVRELQEWGYVDRVEVVDPTWIDVAYTWSWPSSIWKAQVLSALQQHDIYQVGRYGRWVFQGIADSIRDGFTVAVAFRNL